MKVSCANFDRTGDIMIIPVFKDFDKAPTIPQLASAEGQVLQLRLQLLVIQFQER